MKFHKGKDFLIAEGVFVNPPSWNPATDPVEDIRNFDRIATGQMYHNTGKTLEVDMAKMEALMDAELAARDMERRVNELMDRMLFSFLVMAFTVGIPNGYTITMKRWTVESHVEDMTKMVFTVPDVDVFRIEYMKPIGVL